MQTITIRSDKPMVIIPIEEYENMKETIELLSINPNLRLELTEEGKKIEEGDYITYEDFKEKYKIRDR